jgi:hypothetical protein
MSRPVQDPSDVNKFLMIAIYPHGDLIKHRPERPDQAQAFTA